jgi:hypothetical protein
VQAFNDLTLAAGTLPEEESPGMYRLLQLSHIPAK